MTHWMYWDSESPLVEWFKKNYHGLGFDECVSEDENRYIHLKLVLGVRYFPDFLVRKNGRWFRLEVERFSSNYHYTHPDGHSDIVLCYHDNHPSLKPEVISLERLGRLEEITIYQEFEEMLQNKAKEAAKKFAEETRAI